MATFFAFSDDAGNYQQNPNARFLQGNPFFVRSLLIIDADSWKYLRDEYPHKKEGCGLPSNKEIKWSYLWSLISHRKTKTPIPADKDYHFLKDASIKDLMSFYESSCQLLCSCQYCKVALTVTYNYHDHSAEEIWMHKWHLQNIMQRVEMEIKQNDNNLASLHFDNSNYDKEMMDTYNTIYQSGDFIRKYSHIRDCMSLEPSHQSIGLQVADHAAGIFNSYLKNYDFGKRLFTDYLSKLLRRNYKGELMGVGISHIPNTNKTVHELLEKQLATDGIM